jgi:hypothetical protein
MHLYKGASPTYSEPFLCTIFQGSNTRYGSVLRALLVERLTRLSEFHNLKITSTSFGTMEVLHASKMISLLGATYDEYLGPQVAVLACGSNKLNLDKIAFAKDKGIPSVNSSWLWACVDEAHLVDVSKYSMSHQQHELRAASRTPSHEATATLKATTHAGPKGQVHKRYEMSKASLMNPPLIQLGH